MQIEKAMTYFTASLETEQLSEHSIRAYHQDLEQFADEMTKKEIDELDFEDFQDYFLSLNGLKISSLKRKRVVLHRFFKFCYRKKLCKEKVYEYIDPIKSRKNSAPKEVLSKEEIQEVLTYLKEEQEQYQSKQGTPYYDYLYYTAVRNELLIHILLYTGCRAHEVVAIKKQDVNLIQNTITLFTKGGKYNQVPIHEVLEEELKHYEALKATLAPAIQETLGKSPYLFPSRNEPQSYMATRTLHDLMKRLSVLLNRHVHAHLFRHTFASYCIAANMDISTISSLISHSNPSITLSIYTHEIDAHNKQEQIKKLHF